MEARKEEGGGGGRGELRGGPPIRGLGADVGPGNNCTNILVVSIHAQNVG